MEIIRNLMRRKLRNFLTISGIVIGVLALVTMGSLAEKFNALLAGGATYFGSNVQVADDSSGGFGGFGGGGLLTLDKVNQLASVDGVAAAFPAVSVGAKPGSTNVVSFGVPDYIANTDPRENSYSSFKIHLAQGRDINPTGTGEVVLGSDFASEFSKKVGDSIALPIRPKDAPPDFVNHTFTVVGVLAKTQTAPDTGAFISLPDAQTLMKDALPVSVRASIDTTQLVNGATVYGKPGANLDSLADRINAQVPGVKATRPSQVVASFNSGGAIFTAITTGAALIALVVGGLSVINTMLMAVGERVREIGLKKAVGARMGHIMREFLLEAVLIGLIGGAIGLFLGWGVTSLINLGNPSLGLFLLTWRLVVLSLLFSIGLGAAAGIIPAFRAARMDPVRALRAA
ncbi:MAG TPA: ABC transporter permease [Candidatus Limnocylindrales bacterium]|nr:ABC transporter permease [Candidatus Limnocylindrales bacterium]